jgi:hypothetical protein
MSPESCRLCLDDPDIARNCERCGWFDDKGGGQAGDCHRLNGRGERIVTKKRTKRLIGTEPVRGIIVPVGEEEFSFHLVSSSISVQEIRSRHP